MPTVLGVEAGLSAFDTNKSCVLGCSGCSDKVPPTGCLSTDMGSSQFGRLEVQDQADSMAGESCVLTVSSRTGKLLTNGRSSLSVYVSELRCDPMSLSKDH